MRNYLAALMAVAILGSAQVAFASLDDTKETIAQQYGAYRMVIDSDNQLWSRLDWESKGQYKAKASSYTHYFSRNGLSIQLEVTYVREKDGAPVQIQRFTPNMAIKVKELKDYFPEVYALVKHPKALAFGTYAPLSRQFQELQSPVTLGVAVKTEPVKQGAWFTLLAFNVDDEGRLVKEISELNGETYVREFTVERLSKTREGDSLRSGSWQEIKNYF